jgi:hypothetical protein
MNLEKFDELTEKIQAAITDEDNKVPFVESTVAMMLILASLFEACARETGDESTEEMAKGLIRLNDLYFASLGYPKKEETDGN